MSPLSPFSVAPMMNHTDRHFRYLMRGITTKATLYTEMVVDSTLLYGNVEKALAFHDCERPLVLQLASDDPKHLKEAVAIAEDYPYDGYNLNVGCPSHKVQRRNIGACLMRDPSHVASLLSAMTQATEKPVTVKHRIGVEGRESYEDLREFVGVLEAAGTRHFIVHARIAVLKGLNPKQNRSVPPLRYEDVYRLKQDFPALHVEINGGIASPELAKRQLEHVDAVMIGRAAYRDPMLFSELEAAVTGESAQTSRAAVVHRFCEYAERRYEEGVNAHSLLKHMMGIFYRRPGAKKWRETLSTPRPSISEVRRLADELSA